MALAGVDVAVVTVGDGVEQRRTLLQLLCARQAARHARSAQAPGAMGREGEQGTDAWLSM
jgi:hypothetical protein